MRRSAKVWIVRTNFHVLMRRKRHRGELISSIAVPVVEEVWFLSIGSFLEQRVAASKRLLRNDAEREMEGAGT